MQSTHGLLSVVSFQLGPRTPVQYGLEGSVAIAGAGVTWLMENLGLFSNPAEIEELAGSVPDTADVYLVPALGGLFAPHWRPDARGLLMGLTQYTTKAHIARAMLEAICYQTREVLDAMEKDTLQAGAGLSVTALRVDGGASKNALLMQMQADILGKLVMRPPDVETTARGAALAAGLAQGIFSMDAIFEHKSVRSSDCTRHYTTTFAYTCAHHTHACIKFINASRC